MDVQHLAVEPHSYFNGRAGLIPILAMARLSR